MQVDMATSPGRLPRELMRQALLAVAREEFDVGTRDAALGEVAPADLPPEAILDLDPSLFAQAGSGGGDVSVLAKPRSGRVGARPRLPYRAPFPTSSLPAALSLPRPAGETAAGLEATVSAALDAAGGFSKFLREQGLTPRPVGDSATAADAGDIPLRLREMSVVPQFEAVRAAHALPPGVAKDRLLAVGYANLSLLTQHLWSPASKVFAARALVYAERAARAQPGPDSDEVQAYAAALAGLHGAALKHAAAAGVERSPRLQAITAYCRFRPQDLLELSERTPEVRELAAVLACLAADPAGVSTTVETLAAAAEVAPDCFRVYDGEAVSMSIGLLHDVTVRGPQQMTTSVPARLRAAPGLPQTVAEVIAKDEPVLPAAVAERLEAASDLASNPTEPTWPVLGRLLRDEAFVQAHRRLSFMAWQWGVPTSEEYDDFRAFVGEHPYGAVLGVFADPPDYEGLASAVNEFRETKHSDDSKPELWTYSGDFGPRHHSLAGTAKRAGLPRDARTEGPLVLLWRRMFDSTDLTADDLVQVAEAERQLGFQIPSPVDEIDALAAVSPHHPRPRFSSVQRSKATQEQLASIENEWADQPALLTRLGGFYSDVGRLDDAVRLLTRAAEIGPSFETYYMLAQLHRSAGRDDEFAAALEKAFEYPSYSLAEVDARLMLAVHHMRRGDYEAAEPHAAAAAESYAARGIACAIDCYTGLEAWDTAEEWAKRAGERYPGWSSAWWYLWCRRTGCGDEDAAKARADAVYAPLDRPAGELPVPDRNTLTQYRLIEGRDREAGELKESVARDERNPAAALVAAVAFVRAGERDRAAALLGEATGWTASSPKAPHAARRAGFFRDALVGGRPLAPETVRELAEAIETFAERERVAFRAYYGDLMIRLGNREEGLRLLRTAAAAVPSYVGDGGEHYDFNARALASAWLREHLGESEENEDPSTKLRP